MRYCHAERNDVIFWHAFDDAGSHLIHIDGGETAKKETRKLHVYYLSIRLYHRILLEKQQTQAKRQQNKKRR